MQQSISDCVNKKKTKRKLSGKQYRAYTVVTTADCNNFNVFCFKNLQFTKKNCDRGSVAYAYSYVI